MGGTYGYFNTQVFAPISTIKKAMFDPTTSEQPMNMLYLDLPEVYMRTKEGYDLINSLAACDNDKIFDLKST